MLTYATLIALNWRITLRDKAFRRRCILAGIAIIIISFATHFFFDYNEDRKGGAIMNDWLLNKLPAENVSMPITFIMLSVVFLFFIRTLVNPVFFVTSIIAYLLILAFRITTIAATHFQAPLELIDLNDPVSNAVYGSKHITRDLFFSGHVATICLVYLCSFKKWDRYYLLFAAFSVGLLLLVQHVHYTIDIICAPLFSFGCLWLSKKIIHLQYAMRRGHLTTMGL